jgi:stage II sporulation protein D
VEISLRSYIAAQKNRHGGKNYQFCDLTHCSHFPGFSNARGALTEGEIMTERRNGNPVSAFFHSACGGVLTGPEVYWNGHAAGYHYARGGEAFCASAALDWSVFLQAKDMEGIIGAPGLEEISLECEQGRVSRIAYSAKGGRGRIPVSLFMSRAGRALGWNKIRSNLFTVKKVHGGWSFDGKGSGHGVGLCMHGAREMARDGKSAREILNFFYVNPVIGRAD